MLRLVTVCRPAKVFYFYSGHPDVCSAIIIIIDRKIEARRPDIVFIDGKEREIVIIDVAIPGDDRVKEKELEKLEKYQLLKYEIASVAHAISHCSACCYWGPWSRISQL